MLPSRSRKYCRPYSKNFQCDSDIRGKYIKGIYSRGWGVVAEIKGGGYNNYMDKVAGIILLVDNLETSTAFYKKLEFEIKKEVPKTATTIHLGDFWIELLHKSKVVSEEYKKDINNPEKGAGIYLQIQVKDTDVFYDRAVGNGIKPSAKPKDFPWNQREFIVVDPDGYKLAFFNPI